jgi:D-aminopeptidase
MVDFRKLGWNCGLFPPGKKNSITDIPGVSVGHYTLNIGEGKLIPGSGPIRTGISVILPHQGNIFNNKVRAGVFVANGFGKSTGISQIQELGCIETPIAVTNTLNVGLVYDALTEYMINENPEIGITASSVSPIVAECNDGYLNDIQGRHIKTKHVFEAIQNARLSQDVEEGTVGACTGFQVFQLKSGVGTASRVLNKEILNIEEDFHIGAIVFPNYGIYDDFLFYGHKMADILDENKYFPNGRKKPSIILRKKEDGSIIVILATDIPMTSRQLNRLSKRGIVGITRTGSTMGNGSGDFIFTFSTKNQINPEKGNDILHCDFLNDYSPLMELAFRAAGEVVQEAVYKGMIAASSVVGRDNHKIVGLDIEDLPKIRPL